MKNPPFNYHRPASLEEALDLLAAHGDDGKVLAGGQSLLPVMALRLGRPEHVIDIGAIESLGRISVDDGGGGTDGVTIGAMVRHAEAERSAEVARIAPLVTAALPYVGHRAIRSRGTVVGSIAHADAAAEMPAVCLATGATMHLASTTGTRTLDAADFFQGHFTTALEDTELLTGVHFPRAAAGSGATLVEISRRHGDYAMCGLACRVDLTEGRISDAALAFFGVASTAIRLAEAEAALVGNAPSETLFSEAGDAVMETIDPDGDIHATAAYRRHIAGVLTRRGLTEATSRIGAAA